MSFRLEKPSLLSVKKALWAKWLKLGFEKYFLWKMKRGLNGLP